MKPKSTIKISSATQWSPEAVSRSRKRASPSAELLEKMLQTQVKEHDEEHQQLLIRTKQLELKMLEEECAYKEVMREYKKKRKTVQEKQAELKQQDNENSHKRRYLDDFHRYLNQKLTANSPHFNSKIAKLEQVLLAKYDEESSTLTNSLLSLESQSQGKKNSKNAIERERDQLLAKWQQIEQKRFKWGSLLESRIANISQLESQNAFLEQSIEELKKQQIKISTSKRIFQKLVNIEDEHKRHSLIIASGIRKSFSIAMKEIIYKSAVNEQYSRNFPDLQSILQKRRQDREFLDKEVQDKGKRLDKIKNEISEKLMEYSQLENAVIIKTNKK